jgi:hypothetical protein
MADASKWRQYTPRADPGPMPVVFVRPVPFLEQPTVGDPGGRLMGWTRCTLRGRQIMNESEFDPRAALGRMAGAAPTEPPAAGGVTDPPPPAPTHAETRERRRSAALELVARYREAHPGDPRTDDQLLVAPYGGYETMCVNPDLHVVYMERLASLRPPPAEEAGP